MIDASILHRVVDYASLNQNDVVLDIGAGLGFLTRFLAAKCRCVLAVESDDRLVKIMREQLDDLSNVELVEGDILKVSVKQFNKVVSIPPYYISSRLLLWLFSRNFELAVLILQEEFANRLVTSIGRERYGWLSVVAYYYSQSDLLDKVPKWMFYPQPQVDSVITLLRPKKPPPFTLRNERLFKDLTQNLFTQRNRKVRNAIQAFIRARNMISTEDIVDFADSLPFSQKRIRELAPEDFGALANALAD